VTFGDPTLPDDATAEQAIEALRRQVERLAEACAAEGRLVEERILLVDSTRAAALRSVDAFVDFAGAHAELGFTEIVLHWPVPDSVFEADLATFEEIATEAPARLR
jgi:hypothetical protein